MNRRDVLKGLVAAGAAAAGGGLYLYRRHLPGIRPPASPSPGAAAGRFSIQLVDVTRQAGISFEHNSGAFGKKYLPETLGSGCAFFDYDNDGWPDILLVNGADWPGHTRRRTTMKLYRNDRKGGFTDVTREAGLDIEIYGIGVAVGDYDNDGFPDLYITC